MTPGGEVPGVRVGFGFDAHRLDGSPPLKLGGVVVSDNVGVSATSDGDVLCHALIDAVLGASGLGDIGEHFPSDDPSSLGADSIAMLGEVVRLAGESGWQPAHVDGTVVSEHIRVAPHRDEIRSRLARVLAIRPDDVSVKATTTDGLGFIGEGRGLAATAVVTMYRTRAT